MAFDPDKYLAEKQAFDPDAYLSEVPPLAPEALGVLGTSALTAGQAFTSDMLDEGAGVVAAVKDLMGRGFTSVGDLKNAYRASRDEVRAIEEASREAHPIASAVGTGAGILGQIAVTSGLGSALRGAGLASKGAGAIEASGLQKAIAEAGKAAAEGAAYGTLSEVGQAKEMEDLSVSDLVKSAGGGALLGGGLSAGGKPLGGAAKLASDVGETPLVNTFKTQIKKELVGERTFGKGAVEAGNNKLLKSVDDLVDKVGDTTLSAIKDRAKKIASSGEVMSGDEVAEFVSSASNRLDNAVQAGSITASEADKIRELLSDLLIPKNKIVTLEKSVSQLDDAVRIAEKEAAKESASEAYKLNKLKSSLESQANDLEKQLGYAAKNEQAILMAKQGMDAPSTVLPGDLAKMVDDFKASHPLQKQINSLRAEAEALSPNTEKLRRLEDLKARYESAKASLEAAEAMKSGRLMPTKLVTDSVTPTKLATVRSKLGSEAWDRNKAFSKEARSEFKGIQQELGEELKTRVTDLSKTDDVLSSLYGLGENLKTGDLVLNKQIDDTLKQIGNDIQSGVFTKESTANLRDAFLAVIGKAENAGAKPQEMLNRLSSSVNAVNAAAEKAGLPGLGADFVPKLKELAKEEEFWKEMGKHSMLGSKDWEQALFGTATKVITTPIAAGARVAGRVIRSAPVAHTIDGVKQLAAKLKNTPFGPVLEEAANKKSDVSRNALMFALQQNPEFRKYIKSEE